MSTLTREQQPPPEWAHKHQVPEVTQGDIGASRGKAWESAVRSTIPSVLHTSTTLSSSKRVLQRRLQRPRRSHLRRPLDSVTQRRVQRSRSNILRYMARERPRAIPGTSRSLQKYLDSPRLVSLGSWAPSPEVPLKVVECHEFDQKIDEIDLSWSTRFMRLEAGYRLKVWKMRNVGQLVEKYAILLHRSWTHVLKNERLNWWQDTMLWCMQNSPMRALAMLLATFKGRAFRPPRHMVQDCLQLLARHYLFNVSKADPVAKRVIWRLTFNFIESASLENLRSYAISQEMVQLLLKHCNDTQAFSLYEGLVSNRADLHVNTMLHFLARFVDMGKLHSSMGLLQIITSRSVGTWSSFATGVDLSRDQIQAACVKLLRSQWGLEEPYPVQSKILTQMLEMGIRPNTKMYNAILLNMIEGRDFETAWQTYDIARQSHHFVTDEITYGVLAKGAKLSGEPTILENVLRDVNEDRGMLLGNPRLMNSILDAICHLSPEGGFPAMLDFYKQHFDLRPLQELALCGPETQASHHADVNEKWPTKHTLGQMILAYNKFDASSDALVHRYKLYHDFVQEQHPLIAPLAQNDYVANSFLMAFGRRSETLHYCTTVLKHMLSPPSLADSLPHATPTVRTWSILLSAYMRHRQTHAAKKVLTMMRARGLQPDVVSWNTIIGGYAAMQDVEGAIGGMKRMEAEGFQSNARTLKALGRLRDRATLLSMLEESLESPVNVELKKLAKPEEVEAMAEGWEANVSSRDWEIHKYLQSFNERHI